MNIYRLHARLLIAWFYSGALSECCGGRGLAVGCPRCGKVWPS